MSTGFPNTVRCANCESIQRRTKFCPRCGEQFLDSLCGKSLDGGRLHLVHRLGKGGFGTVYKAVHDDAGVVAVKVLHAEHALDERVLRRFHTEVRANFSFTHPNKPDALSTGSDDVSSNGGGRPRTLHWLTMEFCRGRCLENVLREMEDKERLFDLTTVVDLMAQILDVVADAHRHQVVHRDLHPKNIFVEFGAAGEIRATVLDFGIAQILQDQDEETGQVAVGRDYWMSPEQSLGGDIDQRTDIYNLGLLLYKLLTGKHPFLNSDTGEYEPPALAPEPLPPSETGSWAKPILKRFDPIVRKALAKRSERRFGSAEEFREKLQKTLAPRSRVGRVLLVLILLTALAGAAFYLFKQPILDFLNLDGGAR